MTFVLRTMRAGIVLNAHQLMEDMDHQLKIDLHTTHQLTVDKSNVSRACYSMSAVAENSILKSSEAKINMLW